MATLRKRKREIQTENRDINGSFSIFQVAADLKRRKYVEEYALCGERAPLKDVTQRTPRTPSGLLAKGRALSAMFKRTPGSKDSSSAFSRGASLRSSLKLLQRDSVKNPGNRSSLPPEKRASLRHKARTPSGRHGSTGSLPEARAPHESKMVLRSMSKSPGERPIATGRSWSRSSNSSIGSSIASYSSQHSASSLTSGISSMSSSSSVTSTPPAPFSRRPSLRLPSPGLSIKGITLTPESPECDVTNTFNRATKSQVSIGDATPGGRKVKSARRVSLGLGLGNTLRSSMKSKFLETMRKNAMKGKQDYSLPAPVKGEYQYLQFISAQQAKERGKVTDKDQWLQSKIDHEVRMRDGTAKLLAASKQPAQLLEAARTLLTSNARMLAYMGELQRRKTDSLNSSRLEEGSQVPCKGRLCISDIRIPLMWRENDHFKNKGDYRRYAVFCLWKRGTEIYDTSLAKDVDRTQTDICFDDVIVFHDAPADFRLDLEVYCHRLGDDLSIANTPKKIRKKISELGSSVGRSVGRRLSGVAKDDPDYLSNMLIGPKFERIAECTLKVEDVSSNILTYDLTTDNPTGTNSDVASSELPLFGNFCCRLACEPQCVVENTAQGYLTVQNARWDQSKQFYGILKNLRLNCWNRQEDCDVHESVMSIPITKATQVSELSGKEPNRILVNCTVDKKRMDFVLQTASRADFRRWWEGLQQHMLDQVMWQHACEETMEIMEPTGTQSQTYANTRPTSLYEEMPFREEGDGAEDSPMARVLNRLQVEQQNGDFREERRLPLTASTITTDV